MPATSQYHVVLDGQGYLIDLPSYHKSAASPFAHKTSVGDPGYGDLSTGSVWAASDWRGGFGWGAPFENFDPQNPNRYKEGVFIDPSFGDLRLGRSLTSVFAPAGVTGFYQLLAHRGILFAISENTGVVYESTDGGSTWASAFNTAATDGLRSIAQVKGSVVVGEGGGAGRIWTRDSAGVWSLWATVGVATSSTRSLLGWVQTTGSELLFIGHSKNDGTSKLIRSPAPPSAYAATILVDNLSFPHIEALAMGDNRLYFAPVADEGGFGFRGELWRTDQTTLTKIATIGDNAISSMIEWRGKLYAGSRTRGKIWTVESQGLTELFTMPDATFIAGVSQYAFPIRALAIDHDRLHFPVVDTKGLGIYSYDGVGWSRSVAGGLGTEPRGLASFNNRLFISNSVTTAPASIYRVENTHPATGTFVSTWFDAEVPGIDKVLYRATIRHAALVAGESLSLDYSVDGSGVLTNLGASDTDGATDKTFSFAVATKAKTIRFQIGFTRGTDATITPKVTGILLEYALAPDPKAEWSFDTLLEGAPEMPLVRLDNSAEPLTGAALADALWASKAKKQTLAFTDLDAEAKTVWFVDLEESVAKQSQREGQSTRGKALLREA